MRTVSAAEFRPLQLSAAPADAALASKSARLLLLVAVCEIMSENAFPSPVCELIAK